MSFPPLQEVIVAWNVKRHCEYLRALVAWLEFSMSFPRRRESRKNKKVILNLFQDLLKKDAETSSA
jgi:hypothetical protein